MKPKLYKNFHRINREITHNLCKDKTILHHDKQLLEIHTKKLADDIVSYIMADRQNINKCINIMKDNTYTQTETLNYIKLAMSLVIVQQLYKHIQNNLLVNLQTTDEIHACLNIIILKNKPLYTSLTNNISVLLHEKLIKCIDITKHNFYQRNYA